MSAGSNHKQFRFYLTKNSEYRKQQWNNQRKRDYNRQWTERNLDQTKKTKWTAGVKMNQTMKNHKKTNPKQKQTQMIPYRRDILCE